MTPTEVVVLTSSEPLGAGAPVFGTTVPNETLPGPSWPSLTLLTPRNSATSRLAARLRC
jgi:hypothetical protein